MNLTQTIVKDLQNLLYDPTAIQNQLLSYLSNTIDTESIDIPDPSNPFTFLMESNALSTTAALNEISYQMRKLYPILATTKEELYHHLTMNEVNDIFTTPSKATYAFYIHRNSLKSSGYRHGNYVEIVIPRFTKITINELTFTLLNDISIREYDSGSLFVRELGNNKTLGKQDTTVLESGFVFDGNKEEWILFSVELSEITVHNIVDTVITSSAFISEIPITDKYVDVSVKSMMKSNKIEELNKTYSNFVYDPNYPTAYVKPLENSVLINIPILYINNQSIKGNIDITLFTSKGVIKEPIDKYSMEDFLIEFYNVGSTPLTAPLNSITIYAKAVTQTYGGRDEIDFETLKEKVINHTTGNNIIPVTDEEIVEAANRLDYTIRYDNDSLLKREYVVSKPLGDLGYDVPILADVFMEKFKITEEAVDNKYIRRYNKSIVINPFTVFKLEENTNNLSFLKEEELLNISNLKVDKLIIDINSNRLFYTIYKYVIDYEEELLVRAYDLNQPAISNVRDNLLNNNTASTLYITDRSVTREQDNFIIDFQIASDNDFKEINKEYLNIELKLYKNNSNIPIYYYGTVYEEDNILKGKVTIETTGYIDKDNKISLQNFTSNVNVVNLDLECDMRIIIYSIDSALSVNKTDLTNELYEPENKVALYRENATITLGYYLKYLYTNYTSIYTERKYKRYEEDVLLRYREDVYLTDEDGVVFTYTDTDADMVILHHKGDPVLDDDGNTIILHHKGEVMLDEDNNPIIDDIYGIEHLVSLLLLEYQFKVSSNPITKLYMTDLYKRLTDMATVELIYLNKTLLDNTKISYKPYNNLKDVKLKMSNVSYTSKNFVSPVVKLYVTRSDITLEEYNNYLNIISLTLQDGIRKNQKISDIENRIENIIGENVTSVKFSGLDDLEDLDIKSYDTNSSQIVLNKVLGLDDVGTTSVKSDIELKLIKI